MESLAQELEDKIKLYRDKSECFDEYVVIFYVFIEKLWKQLSDKNVKRIAFLSREGWFLKELFDIYQQQKIPKDKHIESKYFKCSRHAIDAINLERRSAGFLKDISIKEYFGAVGFDEEEISQFNVNNIDINKTISDFLQSKEYKSIYEIPELKKTIEKRYEENLYAFQTYVNDIFGDDEDIYICDIGYAGTVQLGLEEIKKRKTHGYYMGRIGDIESDLNLPPERWLDKKGVLFDCSSKAIASAYDYILRSNMLICEMLLYAPHGSTHRYKVENGEVSIIEEWANQERSLYFTHIKTSQDKMKKFFVELCGLNIGEIKDERLTKIIAKLVLKSGLLPNKRRLEFLSLLEESMYTNYWRDTKKIKFRANNVQISIIDLILHPEKYTRYFVKLPMIFYRKRMFLLYKIFGKFLLSYICWKNKI